MRSTRRILLGTNRQSTLLATALGGIVGLGAWGLELLLGLSYWWWPTSPADWVFVGLFVFFATGVAFCQSGLLATCWVGFPAHVVYAHHFYATTSGFVVLPLQNDLLFSVLVSAAFAVLYGTVGYLLGTVGRRVATRLPFGGAGTTA